MGILDGLKVEIFVQDLAGQKEGKFLTLPMKREDLAKALEPYKGEEMYAELVDFNKPAGSKNEKEVLEVGKILSDALHWMTFYTFNNLVKALSIGEFYE